MSAAACSCPHAAAASSDRSLLERNAGGNRRRADGLQLARTHAPTISLGAFAAAEADRPMPSARGCEQPLDQEIPQAARHAQPACRDVQQPLTHMLLSRRVGVATRLATHPVFGRVEVTVRRRREKLVTPRLRQHG